MSNEKMNADFEIWRKEQIASLVRLGYPDAAKAFRDLGSGQWTGWQAGWIASRAAIEVELPEQRNVPDRDCWARTNALGYNTANHECRAAIESLGLKVKP